MKSLPFILISLFTTGMVTAQQSMGTASAAASATIVSEPVGVEKKGDINFSHIQNATTPITTTVGSALNIIGNSNTYSITFPTEDILVKKYGTEDTMTLGSFTVAPSGTDTNNSAIYAAINMNDKQPSGTYVSGQPFTVVINYN